MPEISIKNETKTDGGWIYEVDITGFQFTVTLDEGYWQRLTDSVGKPADLVKKSFEFLLSHEPIESILPRFDLRDIQNFFPEFEREIRPQVY